MTIARARAVISAAVLPILLAGGCSHEVVGVAVKKHFPVGAREACTEVPAPMWPIPAESGDEPLMLVPRPSGWEPVPDPDSELVRFGMSNESPRADHVTLAAVALESKEGHDDPAEVFDDLRRDAEQDPATTDLEFTDSTVCGYPAKTVTFTSLATDELPMRTETMLAVVVHTINKTHAAVVTVSTLDPDNPAYRRDADTILTGFQVLAPT